MDKICSSCGYRTADTTQTACPYCGTPLKEQAEDQGGAQKLRVRFTMPPDRIAGPLCLLAVLAALLLALLLAPEQISRGTRDILTSMQQTMDSWQQPSQSGGEEAQQEQAATDPSGNEILPDTQLPGLALQPEYVLAESARTTWTVATRQDNLNMRAGPGTEYDVVGKLPIGTQVTGCGYSSDGPGNWIVVEYQGSYGWVCTDYLQNNG